MSRLKNLYAYLITNRRAEVDGWLEDYIAFSKDVAAIRDALNNGVKLHEQEAYKGTSFEKTNEPWRAFARKLIYEKANGISSRGQSVLSEENFGRFIGEQDFVTALAAMIAAPTKETFDEFGNAWERARNKHGANRNPLLVNRTLAACTATVSSTVNIPDFDSVYWWLRREKILPAPTIAAEDWYSRNVHLMNHLKEVFKDELANGTTSEQLLSIFVWNMFENISNPFSLKKQVIKYGAPGTGKTYSAKQCSRLLFDIWREKHPSFAPELTFETCIEVVQFHPSYGYEDFIEGLRPELTKEGNSRLTLQNGVFKEFCKSAGRWEIELYAIPGNGPKLAENWETVTVGELRPHIGTALPNSSWQAAASLPDDTRISDVIPPFFFIIDEINRAELSRVLGELMLCIEYRGTKGKISTQYCRMNTQATTMLETGAGPRFFIPHNVYIIGTMNTIDRSVESFDLALRRRFRWERTTPDIEALRYHLKQRDNKSENSSRPWAGLAENLRKLNESIRNEPLLGEDYEIGHAYLMNLRYPDSLNCSEVREQIWEDSIKPLLEEYIRGSGRADDLIPEFAKKFGIS